MAGERPILRNRTSDLFEPFFARTRTFSRTEAPVALECARIAFVRNGSADLFGEFGRQSVGVGDAVLVGPGVLCGAEPDDRCTVTTVGLDMDYAIDQVFWQHSAFLSDRHDAEELAARLYPVPLQIMRLGGPLLVRLAPSLDEFVMLSVTGRLPLWFNRMQELWFGILWAMRPYVEATPKEVAFPRRTHVRLKDPLARRFDPIRADVQAAAYLLRSDPARRWTLNELASAVHLSSSHLSAVFTASYGKSPLAYLTTVRAQCMAKHLRESVLPIEDILRLVGWRSRTHAARVFREHTGFSPSEYRRFHAHSG